MSEAIVRSAVERVVGRVLPEREWHIIWRTPAFRLKWRAPCDVPADEAIRAFECLYEPGTDWMIQVPNVTTFPLPPERNRAG